MLISRPSLACALRRSCPLSYDACPAPAEGARTGYMVEKRLHAIRGGQQVSSPFIVLPSGAYAALSPFFLVSAEPWHQPSPTHSSKALYARGVFEYAGAIKDTVLFCDT